MFNGRGNIVCKEPPKGAVGIVCAENELYDNQLQKCVPKAEVPWVWFIIIIVVIAGIIMLTKLKR